MSTYNSAAEKEDQFLHLLILVSSSLYLLIYAHLTEVVCHVRNKRIYYYYKNIINFVFI
jgi:hypothetical protein